MNKQKHTQSKHPRVYKRITPATVALHEAQAVLLGNNTEATRILEPEYAAPQARAVRIVAKRTDESVQDYIESSLQQIGTQAVARMEQLVNSGDDGVAYRASAYTIDHLRGKAVSRSINVTASGNIQDVL